MALLKPNEVQEKIKQGQGTVCFIDVRSPDEFASGHVPGAMCVPIDEIESGRAAIPRDRTVILSCQSGRRSLRAKELLQRQGYQNLLEMEGGFSAWIGAGLPVSRLRRAIPLMRQVLLTAGSLIATSSLLGFLVHPAFFAVPLFMGLGLTFAGATGWCGLAFLLERMPWNRPAGAGNLGP